MNAIRYIARQVGRLLFVLLVLSMISFALLYLTNSDPARALVGAKKVDPAVLEAIREQYHLNDSLWQQYLYWITDMLHGDFGTSIRTQLPVATMIGQRALVTIELAVFALVLALVIGLPLGVVSAKHYGSGRDKLIGALAVAGLSAPSFAVGLLLLYVLSVQLGWFPVYGLGNAGPLDEFWHLCLPSLTLAIGLIAVVVKISRASLIREIHADYSVFARSRGLNPWKVTLAQLQNAAIPIVTSSGLLMATLISGTVIVETTFSLGGIGTLLQESVTFKDVPTVQAITLLLASIICITTSVVDTIVGLIDPRLRKRSRAERKETTSGEAAAAGVVSGEAEKPQTVGTGKTTEKTTISGANEQNESIAKQLGGKAVTA